MALASAYGGGHEGEELPEDHRERQQQRKEGRHGRGLCGRLANPEGDGKASLRAAGADPHHGGVGRRGRGQRLALWRVERGRGAREQVERRSLTLERDTQALLLASALRQGAARVSQSSRAGPIQGPVEQLQQRMVLPEG